MALVLDASSPAIAYGNASQITTTASFTPPTGARLVCLAALNSGSGNIPTTPGISGGGLTWTLHTWTAFPEYDNVDGQTAIWSAVATGGSLTVAVDNNDSGGATGQAVKVMVFTDDGGGTPGIGPVSPEGCATPSVDTFDALSYTATATGSRGVMAYCDWAATAVPTAGTNTTFTGGGAAAPGDITYAFALQSTNGGVLGVTTTITVNHASTNHRRFSAVEVTPSGGVPAYGPGPVPPTMWPGPGPGVPFQWLNPPLSTINPDPWTDAQADFADLPWTAYDATVQTTSDAAPDAEPAVTVTWPAHDAAADLGAQAGPTNDPTWTTYDATPAAGSSAGTATEAWTAADATTAGTATAEQAAVTWTAYDATVSTVTGAAPDAGHTATAWTGYDATTAATATGDQAAVTLTAADALGAAGPNAGHAATTVTASDATTAATVPAGNAAVTWTGLDAVGQGGAVAEQAATPWTAQDAAGQIGTVADSTGQAYTAYDATVSTTSQVNAGAEPITYPVTAHDATADVRPTADNGGQTFTAADATPAAGASPAQATATITAQQAAPDAGISAGISSATWSAHDATPAHTPTADYAAIAWTAYDATVSTVSTATADAGPTSTAWSAHDATPAGTATPDSAGQSWTASDASGQILANTGQAAATWTANPASVTTGRDAPADVAPLVVTAYAPARLDLTSGVDGVASNFLAFDAAVITVSDVRTFADLDTRGTVATMEPGRPGTIATAETGRAGVTTLHTGPAFTTGERGSAGTIRGGQG